MTILRTRNVAVAVAAALAMMGCTALQPRGPAALSIQPVQSVRHGMSPEQTYRVARALQDQGRTEEAAVALRQVLLADPLHADAHNALAVIHSLRGDAARAEEEFRLAIGLAPQAAYLRDNLALHLERKTAALAPPAAQAAASPQPEAAPVAPPKALPALQPVPVPGASLVRVSESVWQLRDGAFLREVAAPVVVATPALAANAAQTVPEPVALAAAPTLVPAAATHGATRAQPPAMRYRVEVSNGNGTTGLAQRTSMLLPHTSVAAVRLTNHKPYGVVGTVIQYLPGAEAAAREVRDALPVVVPIARVERIERDAAVRLLLGRDFPGRAAPAGVHVASR